MFHDKGYLAEKEVFNTAFNLHLVGWLKAKVFVPTGSFKVFYDVAEPRECWDGI